MTKPRILLLVLSLGANAAFGAWLLLVQPVAPATASAPAAVRPAVAPTQAPAPVDPLTQPLGAETWSGITRLSDQDYVQRLKAEGLPPALIRSLVGTRIYERNKARLDALVPVKKDEYWRRSFPFNLASAEAGMTPDARRERRQIQREISDAVKAAMGTDFDLATPAERAHRERTYGALPADKIARIDAIVADYRDMRNAVSEQSRGLTLPEDRAQLRLLEQEQRADLAAVMTPDELLEYDLRNSPASMRTRMLLTFFEPTEAEFRALTRQRMAFDQQFGSAILSEEEQGRKRTAEAALLAQAKQVLTPERFAEYELVANEEFRSTANAVGRFNFDQTVAREVQRLRRDIVARAAAIEAQAGYTAEQRALELAALYNEASTKLTTRLGAEAYTSFEREGAGNWLRKLKPKPTPPGGARP